MLAAAGPLCLLAVLGLLATHFYHATLILHRQCKTLLANSDAVRKPSGRFAEEGVTLRLLAHNRPMILEKVRRVRSEHT